MNKKTFYVTTPIYYPSGNLHIGHVYTTTLAWILKNYKTLKGYDAKFLTGADEHGQKIEEKAKEAKMNPQEYVDKMTDKFKDLWTLLDIKYDYYSRTTNKNHEEAVKKQFSFLYKEGLIYKGTYKGLYSVQDEEFFTMTQAKKEGDKYYHPISGHELKEVEEESYFFKMSKFEKWIKDYYHKNPDFIIPNKITKELLNNFINKGLEDLSVSRSSFTWGIPINENKKHVIYVWLDALNNYITSLGYNSNDDNDFKKYWVEGDEIVHLVGKEITRFHCIYWPIILKANNIKQPTTILSHGWIITNEGKMSKSKGNVIDPIKLIKEYGPERLKYFLASQIKVGQDGVFEKESFINTLNSDLANNFGNLLSRTVSMYTQNFDKPVIHSEKLSETKKILKAIREAKKNYEVYFDSFDISEALSVATALSRELNGYIDETKPWTLTDNKEKLGEVLNTLLNGIYAVSTMLSVVLPNKMNEALKQLSLKEFDLELITDFTKFNKVIPQKEKVLFERIKI